MIKDTIAELEAERIALYQSLYSCGIPADADYETVLHIQYITAQLHSRNPLTGERSLWEQRRAEKVHARYTPAKRSKKSLFGGRKPKRA